MAGVFGVDEAGKGPALGPMIAAAVAVPDEGTLPEGIDDSKNLTPVRREAIADALASDDRIDVGVAVVPPGRIDDPATDMNTLTVEAHATAIERLADPVTGICDAGDTSEERFARRVAERLPGDVSLAAEHGADARYPIVGAASVVAKVERDARIAALEAEYGPVGSGYPSDPATRAFLAEYVDENGDLPACARASWQTCEDVLGAADQRRLDEF